MRMTVKGSDITRNGCETLSVLIQKSETGHSGKFIYADRRSPSLVSYVSDTVTDRSEYSVVLRLTSAATVYLKTVRGATMSLGDRILERYNEEHQMELGF